MAHRLGGNVKTEPYGSAKSAIFFGTTIRGLGRCRPLVGIRVGAIGIEIRSLTAGAGRFESAYLRYQNAIL